MTAVGVGLVSLVGTAGVHELMKRINKMILALNETIFVMSTVRFLREPILDGAALRSTRINDFFMEPLSAE
jgi:hypothetical protein